MSTPKSKTPRTKKPKTTKKTAVVHDFIDNQEGLSHSDVEVIAGDVDIANANVSDVAVVKVSSDEPKNTTHETGDDNHDNQNLSDENQGKDKDNKGDEHKPTHANDNKNPTKSAQEIAKETAQNKLAELAKQLDDLGDKERIKQQAQQALHTAQDTLANTAQTAKEHLQELTGHDVDETARLVNDKLSDAKQGLQQTLSDVQDKAEQVVQEAQKNAQTLAERAKETLDDAKEQAKQTLDNISEQTTKQADELLDKAENLLGKEQDKEQDKDEKHQPANDPTTNETTDEHEQAHEQKTHDKSVKKSHTLKGLGGLLATAGAYLTMNNKAYQGVDLTPDADARHAFDIQGVTLGGQFAQAILGQKKATTAQNLAQKLVSDDKLTAISEGVYEKIAEVAQAWAIKTLPDPKTLSMSEKDELAYAITNQNRTLATAGGGLGLFGLTGVVADTAWLLLIALRTVYQLALIYEQPLRGKEGINIAYRVLSGADLSQMQQKQVILIALALAGRVLSKADEGSLKSELIKLSTTNNTLSDFDDLLKFTHLDKFADKYGIDVDNLNTRWLRHISSLTAVGVGTHYNRLLIDEIIGTALATFKTQDKDSATPHLTYQQEIPK